MYAVISTSRSQAAVRGWPEVVMFRHALYRAGWAFLLRPSVFQMVANSGDLEDQEARRRADATQNWQKRWKVPKVKVATNVTMVSHVQIEHLCRVYTTVHQMHHLLV